MSVWLNLFAIRARTSFKTFTQSLLLCFLILELSRYDAFCICGPVFRYNPHKIRIFTVGWRISGLDVVKKKIVEVLGPFQGMKVPEVSNRSTFSHEVCPIWIITPFNGNGFSSFFNYLQKFVFRFCERTEVLARQKVHRQASQPIWRTEHAPNMPIQDQPGILYATHCRQICYSDASLKARKRMALGAVCGQ